MLIAQINAGLYKIFDLVNEKFFEQKLPIPAITIQSKGGKFAHTWFVCDKVWHNQLNPDNNLYEINICAESLSSPIEQIFNFMIHEACHYYNCIENIKDGTGYYHNKNFKSQAEKRGLKVEKIKPYGYAITTLTDETLEWVKTLNINRELFQTKRTMTTASDFKPKSWSCECSTVKSKEAINCICLNCNKPFKTISQESGG